MKRIKATLLIWAALGMPAVPSFANAPTTGTHELTQQQCEDLGGWWHCFLNGRCSCF